MVESPSGSHTDPSPLPDPGAEQAREHLGAFSEYLGLEFTEVTSAHAIARWTLRAQLHQPFGIVHGGAHAAVVETVGSIGALHHLDGAGHAVGVNNNTDFYRPVSKGVLTAEGVPVHQGRSQQVWQVDIRDERGRLISRGILRLHNIYRS